MLTCVDAVHRIVLVSTKNICEARVSQNEILIDLLINVNSLNENSKRAFLSGMALPERAYSRALDNSSLQELERPGESDWKGLFRVRTRCGIGNTMQYNTIQNNTI